MTYPTAIGCGCLLGAGGMPLHAAQWSLQPVLSWQTDFDSNRSIEPDGQGSEQAVLSADAFLQRSLENLQFTLQPHFDLRRYSDSEWSPGDDRSVAGTFSWNGERSQLSLNGSIANQNTLTTELLETGIIDTNGRRRTASGGGELDLGRTEEHLFFTQLSYLGTSYSGPLLTELELPGYRYYSAASGERFILSEHWTFSASAFGDLLHSDRAGDSSQEAGGQVELKYSHSEQTTFDIQVGESRRVLAATESPGTNATGRATASLGTNALASATHKFEISSVSLSYSRSLVPYGNGFLVERQQITASAMRSLTPTLDADISAIRIDNNKSTVQLELDRAYYDNLGAGLTWRLSEHWSLRSEATTSWSPPINYPHTVHEWRTALTMTWTPLPTVVSR
jgi:hypothetical protein